MSNYYISRCCSAEAKYISAGEKQATGQCTQCKEMTILEAVIDDNSNAKTN